MCPSQTKRILTQHQKMMSQRNNLKSIIQNTLFTVTVIVTVFYLVQTNAAATHGGREREADGAFSPRDKQHGEGDKHNSKFDHEAILGKLRKRILLDWEYCFNM